MFYGNPRDLNSVNLGRIVPPPNQGTDTSPTYFPPRLYIVGAGAAGLAANAADKASNVALNRSNETATGSPNTVTPVGSAQTKGLAGDKVSSLIRIIQPMSAISGPGGAPVAPVVQKTPKWVKPALYAAGGFVVAWVVFRG